MNVVQRESLVNSKINTRSKNELVRKDQSTGIRGTTSFLPTMTYSNIANNVRASNKVPRYKFSAEESLRTTGKSSMGPPTGLPKNLKRKLITNSSSTRPGSSSSGKARPRIIASDSATGDTSHDMCTPRNRPTALRYISSSSRGGYSGTRSTRSTSTSALDATVILAISEGRGMARGEIGMAAVDLRHPHLVLCQFSDTLLYTHTLTKINYFNPIEIIVPHTFCDGAQPNQLYQLIKDQYPLINLTTVQRKHFNDAAGRQHIQTLCAPQYNAVYLQVLHKFYALTAAAAVLKYVEYIQCIVFVRESLKIEYHSSENTMIIDVGTATQLELVQPLVASAGPSCCLLGVLGPMYTIGGMRALRAAILQPSCNKELIEARLDAVQDLIENDSGLMTSLQDVIKKLSDIDKILLLCIDSQNQNMDKMSEAQLNQVLLLKTTMEMVPVMVEALATAESGRLRKIKMDFENSHYTEIAQRIRNIIQEEAHLEKGAMGSLQRCFAVKPDINGLLDVARRTYSELIEDIQKIVEQLSETYDLPIRLNQNVMKGFHIVLPIAPKNRRHFNIEDLPPIFIQVQKNGTHVSMTTEELVILDQQSKESLSEIQKMSNIVISSLLKDLRPFMSSLYKLCENVAELDILMALAQASSVGSYIRPEFSNYMDVRNSVHPLLDYNSQVMPVPNDIYASPEQNFTIITGPNMGGKSIYIKQIAIMQVMAQLGCFLPATNAVVRMCDRIFSRIGFNDSVELNASTYVFEMKEVQHILKGLTPSSLVIIDELCRGTNSEEGTSIAWAICEELLMSDAFTFFTTHFIYLTRLQDLYPNVANRHTAVVEEEIADPKEPYKKLLYQHKIESGVTKIHNYGLALASKTNLPEDTVKLAIEIAELIKKNTGAQEIRTPQNSDEDVLYKLNARIRLESRRNTSPDNNIKQMIQNFKRENSQLMERLKIQTHKSDKPNTDITAPSILSTDHAVISTNKENSSESIVSSDGLRNVSQNVNKTHDYNNMDHVNRQEVKIVRSSNELLNTIAYNDLSTSQEIDRMSEDLNISSDRNDNEISDFHENLALVNNRANSDKQHPSVETPDVNAKNNNECPVLENSPNNIDEISNENEIQDNGNKEIDTSDDSDIAEALTQIIEEYSTETETLALSIDNMSIDEDLMQETVNEINQELFGEIRNVDEIVLTPPLEFRDT